MRDAWGQILAPEHREIVAAAIGAQVIDDPRAFNAWMNQGVVLLRQQAEAEKAARRPASVVIEDEPGEDSGIPTDSGPVGDGAARWAARVAARHGVEVSRETNFVPQEAPAQQASFDPALVDLVRAVVREYTGSPVNGMALAPLPQAAGYGHPTQPVYPPHPLAQRAPAPWPYQGYDPRRRW